MKSSSSLIAVSAVVGLAAIIVVVLLSRAPTQVPSLTGASIVPATGTSLNPNALPSVVTTKLYKNDKLGFSVELPTADSFATDGRDSVAFSGDAMAPWHFSIDAIGKGIYEYHVPVYADTEVWLKDQAQTPPSADVPSIQFLQWEAGADGTQFALYAQYVVTDMNAGKPIFGRQLAATHAGDGRIYTITAGATYPVTGDITVEPEFLSLIQSFKLLAQ
ncbi:MAG: hypothetical protein WC802_03930 [Patescibacteria group bacterium]|jgi:hypothetical protein